MKNNIVFLISGLTFCVLFIVQLVIMFKTDRFDLLAYTVLFSAVLGFFNVTIRFIIQKRKNPDK